MYFIIINEYLNNFYINKNEANKTINKETKLL